VCHSTCCNNTASEHRMMERLMVDDLVHWARDYKADGFRFDIMGHHFVSNMARVREALDGLTLEKDGGWRCLPFVSRGGGGGGGVLEPRRERKIALPRDRPQRRPSPIPLFPPFHIQHPSTPPPPPTTTGVDGRNVYIYGESWDFGEVALNARGRNATQHNTGGTGLGSFNDRLRDGAMGGSPYHPPDTQGFVTGLYVDPNERAVREAAAFGAAAAAAQASLDDEVGGGGGGGGDPSSLPSSPSSSRDELVRRGLEQRDLPELLERTDWVRYSLAGNLADYATVATVPVAARSPSAAGPVPQQQEGQVLAGRALRYHGNQPLCYGRLPCEHVAYVGCHDNETIFDQVAARLPFRATADDRARACRLAAALSLLSIGVPFLHAGDDLLRSKSLDRDSYDSGDWFNAIDWTGDLGNGFGKGLPPASKNAANWPAKRKLLADAARVAPTAAMRRSAARYVRALLRARYSSPLFRMSDAAHVCSQVRFCNTGPDQTPGVIVMVLTSAGAAAAAAGASSAAAPGGGGTRDDRHASVVCVFNARPEPYECPFPVGGEGGGGTGVLRLHPALEALRGAPAGDERDEAVEGCWADAAARRLVVAARTAAVFVEDWAAA
jgi:hypothetical protein